MRLGNTETTWSRLGLQTGLALVLLLSCVTLILAQTPASYASDTTTYNCHSRTLELRSGNTEHGSVCCRRLGLCPSHTFSGLNTGSPLSIPAPRNDQAWNFLVGAPLRGLTLAPEPPPPRRHV
ncbi:exported protein of unknown function [Candidatus Filomicrobium marinum]|uniref:Uncharacterized protein n=1 Tax=Candidatus Filomicrobium marinum TaxID=1608628 RepID=A0A0D6JGL2_9HYPH|nr:exported protein of unknown function [Candidatus Filomicrobium marinum]CPR19721.1 exported protein of unknown function [Candidatus Filomicrobium marinum]